MQNEMLQNIIKDLKNELNITKLELNKLSQYNSINTSKIITLINSPRDEPLRAPKINQVESKI